MLNLIQYPERFADDSVWPRWTLNRNQGDEEEFFEALIQKIHR